MRGLRPAAALLAGPLVAMASEAFRIAGGKGQ